MSDIYAALTGATPTTEEQRNALVQALRGQKLMGQLGSLTGDPVLSPVGQNLMKGADTGAEQIGQLGLSQTRAAQEKAYQTAEMGHMTAEENQAQNALAETVRQHDLENQAKRWEFGIGADGGRDSTYQGIVDKIGKYEMAPLSTAGRNPRNLNIMGDVAAAYPDYDDTFYNNRKKTVAYFGGSGKGGNAIRMADAAIQHMGVLDETVTALDNYSKGGIPVEALNSAKNFLKKTLGLSTAPTDFAATKKIVADEVTKFIVAAGSTGAVFDREAMEKEVNASMTPQALRGVMKKWVDLMHGQMNSYQNEYEVNTHNTDFQTKLSPETRTRLGLGGDSGPHSAGGSTGHPDDINALVGKYNAMGAGTATPNNPHADPRSIPPDPPSQPSDFAPAR